MLRRPQRFTKYLHSITFCAKKAKSRNVATSEIIKFFRNRSRKPIPRGFQSRIRESYQPNSPKKTTGENMGSVSTGPTPALFTLRSLPSFALAFGSRSGPHCPPTFGAPAVSHPATQPDPTITPQSSSRTPQRSPASTHPSTRSRPHACAHAHEHTPTHAPASHAYTFASRTRTPAHARAPALHTHSSIS